jgi:hypothetical protein
MIHRLSAIVQKLLNYCNVLRDDGMSYGDYVEQLTYLLFLKMVDERTKPKEIIAPAIRARSCIHTFAPCVHCSPSGSHRVFDSPCAGADDTTDSHAA